MSSLQLAADAASLPELAACLLAARRPALRPLAAILAADLASDVVQRAAVAAYPLGHAWALYRLAQAAHLAWPALVAWLCLRAWGTAPRWPVAAAWALAVVAAGLGAPVADAPAYAAAEGLAVVVGLGALGRHAVRRARPADVHQTCRCAPDLPARAEVLGLRVAVHDPLARAALVVLLGELAVVLAPYAVAPLLGVQPSEAWALALVARYTTWLGLCVLALPAEKSRPGSAAG